MPERMPYIAGVDWGTTRLRTWLLAKDGSVLAERKSDRGLLAVPERGFADTLERELSDMGAPADLPALICGMAGSRQGWVEVPYLATPVPLDRLGQGATEVPGTLRPVFILPGVAQNTIGHEDVMRGEETQIAGATALLSAGSHVVCLPGTHSKWASVEDGVLTGFTTYLTGEMFALVCQHSILRHSVGAERNVSAQNPVFRDRLRASLRHPDGLLSQMFSIRASGLLSGLSPEDAVAALSGHLIGCEVAAALGHMRNGARQVLLVAAGPTAALYEEALRQAEVECLHHDAEEAVRAGLLRAVQNLPS